MSEKPILFSAEMVLDVVLKEIPLAHCEDYRAGSDGRIYSRTSFAGFGIKKYTNWYPLSEASTGKYQSVSISSGGLKETYNVHQLICLAFHGVPNIGQQVRHLNGNRLNNSPDNLAWGTKEEDWEDKRRCGTATVGEKHPMSKLSNKQRSEIVHKYLSSGCSQRQLAIEYGVSQYAIYKVLKQKEKWVIEFERMGVQP